MIEVYTDGSCQPNGKIPNRGGWGFVLNLNDELLTFSDGENNTTNNIMELTAVIKALDFLSLNLKENSDEKIIIYTDSAYIQSCFKDKWYKKWEKNNWRTAKGTPVKNKELWIELFAKLRNFKNIKIEKVLAHSGVEMNELADNLAVAACGKLSF